MSLLAATRRVPGRSPAGLRPRVSVVVASRDPNSAVSRRVGDLLATDYPHDLLEVVVALDASRSGDPVPDFSRWANVRVVPGDAPGGKAMNLNAAVRASSGDVLVFTDTAQRFAPDTIDRLVDALTADPRLGAVSGALQLSAPASRSVAGIYWRYERWLRSMEARVHSAVGVTGAVYAMPARLWEPLPAGLILDDVFVPMRLALRGYRIGFVSSAVAVDERDFTPHQESRRKERTLAGVLQLCAWLPDVLKPWRNPIWVQFVCHKLLRLLTPYAALLIVAGVTVWLVRVLEPRLGLVTVSLGLVALTLVVLGSSLVRRAVAETALLLAATVRAPVHALRGNWDVWRR